ESQYGRRCLAPVDALPSSPALAVIPPITVIPAKSGDDSEAGAAAEACKSRACHEDRHGRACPGHPRLSGFVAAKTWMPGTSPGKTSYGTSLGMTSFCAFPFKLPATQ